ncbi:MAG: tetratricopeptide repeat protein [Lentisphaerae bacterium]|nr:tetratricopeptide repeat protein [Lentisphaerota bacterium]MCP4101501.1 tetratricopeptide repeat protein [Lentisphaerota bacterium]
MNKSLLPLIIILGVIVLATAVLVNIRDARTAAASGSKTGDTSISLSPFEEEQGAHVTKKKTDEEVKYQVNRILLQAYNALERGDVDQAENQVKTILIFEPENYDALSLLGRIFYLKRKFKSAEAIYRRLIILNSKDPAIRNNLGQTLLKQQKYQRAVNELTAAYKLKPDSGVISLNLASALSQEGDRKLSLYYFKQAYKLLGKRILTAAHTPNLDPVRNNPEFRKIIAEARAKLLSKSNEGGKADTSNQKANKSGTDEQDKNTSGELEQ